MSSDDDRAGLVVGINAGRRRAPTEVWRYFAALGFVVILIIGFAVVALTSPLTGKGTISASQLSTSDKRPQDIHGFRHLSPGEAPDSNDIEP